MKILCVSCEDDGPEGMFTEEGKFLSGWHANDATWRDYFDEFLQKCGITIVYSNRKDLKNILEKKFQ